MNRIANFIILLSLVSFSCCAHAAQYSIKSCYFGRTAFDFTEGSLGVWLRTNLVDQNNFGASGIVDDVEFTSISQSASFDYSDYSDSDIFVAIFGDQSSESLTQQQVQGMYDFVQNGGSLIVVADYTTYALLNANMVGSAFGGVTFGNNSSSGVSTFSDYTSMPEITNGPFGIVDQFQWSGNSAPRIIDEGDSTILDSLGVISAMAPENGSGSVLFFHDPYNFYGICASSIDPYDYDTLALNMFSYSAHSVDGGVAGSAVPEPISLSLLLMTIPALLIKYRSV